MGKYTSEDETIITQVGEIYLTENRIIDKDTGYIFKNYKDLQLDQIIGFEYTRDANWRYIQAAGFSGLATILSLGMPDIALVNTQIIATLLTGLTAIMTILSLLSVSREYVIKSTNHEVEITLPKRADVFEFWNKVNKQRNL